MQSYLTLYTACDKVLLVLFVDAHAICRTYKCVYIYTLCIYIHIYEHICIHKGKFVLLNDASRAD